MRNTTKRLLLATAVVAVVAASAGYPQLRRRRLGPAVAAEMCRPALASPSIFPHPLLPSLSLNSAFLVGLILRPSVFIPRSTFTSKESVRAEMAGGRAGGRG